MPKESSSRMQKWPSSTLCPPNSTVTGTTHFYLVSIRSAHVICAHALSGFGGRVHAGIEFKKPSPGPLDQFAGQLLDNYVRPQLAIFGVLTNGVEMIVYARTNGEFPEQANFKLQETSDAQRSEERRVRKEHRSPW